MATSELENCSTATADDADAGGGSITEAISDNWCQYYDALGTSLATLPSLIGHFIFGCSLAHQPDKIESDVTQLPAHPTAVFARVQLEGGAAQTGAMIA